MRVDRSGFSYSVPFTKNQLPSVPLSIFKAAKEAASSLARGGEHLIKAPVLLVGTAIAAPVALLTLPLRMSEKTKVINAYALGAFTSLPIVAGQAVLKAGSEMMQAGRQLSEPIIRGKKEGKLNLSTELFMKKFQTIMSQVETANPVFREQVRGVEKKIKSLSFHQKESLFSNPYIKQFLSLPEELNNPIWKDEKTYDLIFEIIKSI